MVMGDCVGIESGINGFIRRNRRVIEKRRYCSNKKIRR